MKLNMRKEWRIGLSWLIPASILIFLVTAFILDKPTTESGKLLLPQQPDTSFFPLGAMENQTDYDHKYITDATKFGMSLWHHYTGSAYNSITNKFMPQGWSADGKELSDSLFADSSTYWPSVKIYLDKEAGVSDASFKIKMLMQRPKIEWLCYGQRSDYQCEDTQYVDNYYWFYTFQSPNHVGRDEQDVSPYGNNQWVRYCRPHNSTNQGNWVDNPGTVVSRFRANNEQNLTSHPGVYYHGDDSQYRWFIKPRIRIDSSYAYYNQLMPVCSIKVIGSNGIPLKEQIIRAGYFRNPATNSYKGEYLEEFYLPQGDSLSIYGAWGPASYYGSWCVRGNRQTDASGNQTDIEVYWYGNCDMWIDYVRVDNDIANDLFSTDPNNTRHQKYEQWIKWEASVAKYEPPNHYKPQYRFYIEELDMNNVPCIGYINQKLQQYTSPDTVDMTVCFYWRNFTSPIPNNYVDAGKWSSTKNIDGEAIYRVFIQPAHLREFFTEIYPFTCNDVGNSQQQLFSEVPTTVPSTNSGCNFTNYVSPAAYETWLQDQLDHSPYPNPIWPEDPGWFTWAIKAANYISTNYDKPFITMPQAHLVRTPGIENRREPTNEEMKLITNLAISYGTKGIMFFWYGGFGQCNAGNSDIGFLSSTDANGQHPRTLNAYGEDKWDSLISIHKIIRKWGPSLLRFDNTQTNSYIYRLDYSTVNSSTIFSDIQTYIPNPNDFNNPNSTPENYPERYVQAATFKAENDNTNKYFMLVNRRCSPFYAPGKDPRFPNGENGGRRYIKVRFNENNLQTSTTWRIINLEDNTEAGRFNTSGNPIINLGWFQPGEGKLYKLEPLQ